MVTGLIFATAISTPSCIKSQNQTPPLDAGNTPNTTTTVYWEPNSPVIPHRTSQVATSISSHGAKLLEDPDQDVELILNGGLEADCITTVLMTVEDAQNGKRKINLSPGISTSFKDIDATSMNLSVHLDVDAGQEVTSTSIPADDIKDPVAIKSAAVKMLDAAKTGCKIWERDIEPKIDR